MKFISLKGGRYLVFCMNILVWECKTDILFMGDHEK